MKNLDGILKRRDIIFLTKVHVVKAMVFPVVMYGFESWILKKTENQRIYAFELWYWRRLENPLDFEIRSVNPKGNQPWIFIDRTDAEAKALIRCSPDAKSWLIGKILILGKTEDKRRRGQPRMR